mmetsp:Transcript_4578/g.8004  ORF Transcript_4578/g.8004 Transcript_4578/m.8004 type:complete len:219 (-) Transcript_4578:738-1394(-)
MGRGIFEEWRVRFGNGGIVGSSSTIGSQLSKVDSDLEQFRNAPGLITDKTILSELDSLNTETKSKSKSKSATSNNSIIKNGTVSDQEIARMSMILQRSWNLAFAPAQQLIYVGFVLWMAGSGLHIFSIMTTLTCVFMSIQSVFSAFSGNAFAALEAEMPSCRKYLWPQKIVAMLLSLITFGLAVRKCINLRFLPTSPADWVALLPLYEHQQHAATIFL